MKVTIGRVHIRAVMPPAPTSKAERPASPPTVSLEDYLAQDPWGRS